MDSLTLTMKTLLNATCAINGIGFISWNNLSLRFQLKNNLKQKNVNLNKKNVNVNHTKKSKNWRPVRRSWMILSIHWWYLRSYATNVSWKRGKRIETRVVAMVGSINLLISKTEFTNCFIFQACTKIWEMQQKESQALLKTTITNHSLEARGKFKEMNSYSKCSRWHYVRFFWLESS